VSVLDHFRPQFEILAHFRRLIYRRVVYTGTSHVITSLNLRAVAYHTVCDRKLGGAWERGWGEPGDKARGSLGTRLGEPGNEAEESLGTRLGGAWERGWGGSLGTRLDTTTTHL